MKTLVTLALFYVMTTRTLLSQRPVSDTATLMTDWPAFTPEKMPPGKFVTEADVGKLAAAGDLREVLYLIGKFRVTARGVGRVVMRSDSKVGLIRVVADYPSSIPTPAEGTKLSRESRGLLITGIRRDPDGQTTVYVREIMLPLTASRR